MRKLLVTFFVLLDALMVSGQPQNYSLQTDRTVTYNNLKNDFQNPPAESRLRCYWWWLDRSFAVLEVGNYLKAGENTLAITAAPMSVYAEIEPVYILGDFNLESAQKGWKLIPKQPLQLGSWKRQGLPLYGHSISYVKTLSIENIGRQFEVQLGEWKGTVAAVKVNGIPAGIIISEPNSLNITKYLKKGVNRIEVGVVGSLKNLLGPHHNSPSPGMVGPGHWGNVKSYPSGKDYETYDYGLMEDFYIYKIHSTQLPYHD